MSPTGLSSGVPLPEGHLPLLEAAPLGVPSEPTQMGVTRRATRAGMEVFSTSCLSCIDPELSIMNRMSILPWLVVGDAPPLAPVTEAPPAPPAPALVGPAPAFVGPAPAFVGPAPAFVGGSLSLRVGLTLPAHAIIHTAAPNNANVRSLVVIFESIPDAESQKNRPPPIAIGATVACVDARTMRTRSPIASDARFTRRWAGDREGALISYNVLAHRMPY